MSFPTLIINPTGSIISYLQGIVPFDYDSVSYEEISDNKILAVYNFGTDNYARILTLSGDTLIPGTEYLIGARDGDVNVTSLGTNKYAVGCRAGSNIYLNVLTVSGSTISVGVESIYTYAFTGKWDITSLGGDNFIITHGETSSIYDADIYYAAVCIVTGTTIAVNSTVVQPYTLYGSLFVECVQIDTNTVLLTFANTEYGADSYYEYLRGVIITVSGTVPTFNTLRTLASGRNGSARFTGAYVAVMSTSRIALIYRHQITTTGSAKRTNIAVLSVVGDLITTLDTHEYLLESSASGNDFMALSIAKVSTNTVHATISLGVYDVRALVIGTTGDIVSVTSDTLIEAKGFGDRSTSIITTKIGENKSIGFYNNISTLINKYAIIE